MNISVILAHPDKSSFNHAIAEAVVKTLKGNGHEVIFHDLYDEEFAPLLQAKEIRAGAPLSTTIQILCREIAEAKGIVIVHPNWWGQPPAILTGWIDRVFRPEVAYKFLEGDSGAGVPLGLLLAQAAIVFNTSNTPPERETEVFGDPLETIWKNCIFGLCGIKNFHRRNFSVVVTSTQEERKLWLKEVEEIINKYFPKI